MQARLRISVSDDGLGFDPLHLRPNVGLANVRARVEMTGGMLRIESTPGEGTTVRMDIVTS